MKNLNEELPDFVIQFIIEVLKKHNVNRILDPFAGTGCFLNPIASLINPKEAIGIEPNPENYKQAKNSESNLPTRWLLGEPLDILEGIEGEFEVIICNLPMNIGQQKELTISYQEKQVVVKDYESNLTLLKASTLLHKKGIAFYVVSQEFFFDRKIIPALNRLGFYVDAVFSDFFSNSNNTYLIAITQKEEPITFRCSLKQELSQREKLEECQKKIIENWKKRKIKQLFNKNLLQIEKLTSTKQIEIEKKIKIDNQSKLKQTTIDTGKLKKFAQEARRKLMEQIKIRVEQVLKSDSVELREKEKAVKELQKEIEQTSKEEVIEKVAYLWFNRFCALRFMDVNRYTTIGIASPGEGGTQPEILAEAKQGHISDFLEHYLKQQIVFDLLSGKVPSHNPEVEAYRLLLVACCNYYNTIMPFLFEKIEDYTELLLPEDLLSKNSILEAIRETMTTEACQDVEVIGWLYQFYISEKKDEVFVGLKKGKKIQSKDIPAATQLFTPNWIVRYLVENSLGRLWMLNKPTSKLKEQMEYYIESEEQETDFLKISKAEELNICDPACGSGHMLVYAFDLLYKIYEEEGYNANEIPQLILDNNLYGIEIDKRAGALASFALVMKAREKYKRFFNKPIQPNICVLENIKFDENELKDYIEATDQDLFSANLKTLLTQFEEADNFGSLIKPVITDVDNIRKLLEQKNFSEDIFLSNTHRLVLKVLKQSDYLSPKYHIVIANPPYMGGKGMNPRLKNFAQENFKDTKSDPFSMFTERFMGMVPKGSFIGLMTPLTWMFLSSYEKLRGLILNKNTLTTLIRPEYNAFWSSAHVPLCTFTLFKNSLSEYKGAFIDLNKFYGANIQSTKTLEAIQNPNCGWFYRASAEDFKKIPGSPIAYWVSEEFRKIFEEGCLTDFGVTPATGLQTGDNTQFIRYWYEVSKNLNASKWLPLNNGGDVRKWYGNFLSYIDWANNGSEIKNHKSSVVRNPKFYFESGGTWNRISSSFFAVRFLPEGFIFDQAGDSFFSDSCEKIFFLIAFLNSKIGFSCMQILCPTLNTTAGNLELFPYPKRALKNLLSILERTKKLIDLSRKDWDSYEISWDFSSLPILQNNLKSSLRLKLLYDNFNGEWKAMIDEFQKLEIENNYTFIESYGLEEELTPCVPLEEITLTCNFHYRYGGDKTEEELETLLLADTMKEFLSYSVGCMFGRYSLDKPGLILANQGETTKEYYSQIPEPTFEPDEDNVIPILDGDWFSDDITERFLKFLKITFGEEHYEENLEFIEKAIGKTIRKFFLKDFYSDHLKRYKKRPIYWLFSSPKGSFNALIYMHRYRPDTVSIVLNDYLREFATKLSSKKEHLEQLSISASESKNEKAKALKEIEKLKKILVELEEYERDILYPLATEKIEIDLDDGVKVNYPKFGKALKKIPGL